MTALRVLAIPGSARAGSYNLTLARLAQRGLEAQGAQVTLADLRALALPIYDGDIEASAGVPEAARRLCADFAAHDAVLVVSPEYNAFPPPLLMNAIDWVSRLPESKPAWAGKPTALLSASPGMLGGARGLLALRQFLGLNPGLLVLPQQLGVSQAATAFTPEGELKDDKQRAALDGVLAALLRMAETLRAARG